MKEVYPSAEGNLSLINYPEGMAGDRARPPDIISVLSMKQESSNIHDERTSGPGRQDRPHHSGSLENSWQGRLKH